jgi:hypothetical protein
MNALLKVAVCFLVIVVGFLATVILVQPLIGMRGAPWFNFYAFEMVLVWGVVVLTCATVLIQAVSSGVGVGLGNWIRGGGFWAVWSKNNIPGNTWVVLALLLSINAITYGPPTPRVDWESVQHQTTQSVQKTVAQPETQSVVAGAKGTINYLAKGILGQEVIGQGESKSEESTELAPRYYKGWWRIWVALFATLFAPLVWVWGRRNELADKISAFADRFREKRETSGSATSGSSGGGMASNLMKKIVGQTDESSQIANHVIGEFLTRAAEAVFGSLAKLMKKY